MDSRLRGNDRMGRAAAAASAGLPGAVGTAGLWIPACAGMTERGAGMTGSGLRMTIGWGFRDLLGRNRLP